MYSLFNKLRGLTERQWQYKWNIGDLWKQGEDRSLPAYEFADKLLKLMEMSDWRKAHRDDPELEEIIGDFKLFVLNKNEEYDDFDELWDMFYDWADGASVWVNIWRP